MLPLSIYDASVSRSYISSVTDAVMEDVRRFGEMRMPSKVFCLYSDSTYAPLRRRTVQREAILGYSITPEESSEAYAELLQSLKSRGLQDVRVVVSDGIPGIEGFNKQIKRELKKQIQFVTEEALEKRIVTLFLHFNNGVDTRKVRRWRAIVDMMAE